MPKFLKSVYDLGLQKLYWTQLVCLSALALTTQILFNMAPLRKMSPNYRKHTQRIRSRFDVGGRVGEGQFRRPRTPTARRRAVKSCRTLTFTLLASQLDVTELEVAYRGRPWPHGPIDWPSRTIRPRYWPKYRKNERQEAAGGQTGSRNMAAARYFDSATPTSYSASYTPERRRHDVEPYKVVELSLLHYSRVS